MSQTPTTLETFFEGWERYQTNLAKAIAPLSTDQLALRAAPQLRSIGTHVAHIVAARAYWFHHVMGEGDTNFGALSELDEQDTYTSAELEQGLEITWRMMQNAFARWTPAELAAEIFPRTWRGQTYMLSRQWVIWHLLEHDLHHGGEVSLTLGMHGLEAPDV